MISNFFVANTAFAVNAGDTTPPTASSTFTTGVDKGYSLNFAWTWNKYDNTPADQHFEISAININIPLLWEAGTDGLMFYRMNDAQKYNMLPNQYISTPTDTALTKYPQDKYAYYMECIKSGGGGVLVGTCENDLISDDRVVFIVEINTGRLMDFGKLLDNAFTPYQPGGIINTPFNDTANRPFIGNLKIYRTERPTMLKVLDDIVKNLRAGKVIKFAPAISPADDLAASLKQIGSYVVRKEISKSYSNDFFGPCDIDKDTLVTFSGGASRDDVINNPSKSNRPQLEMLSGQQLIDKINAAKLTFNDCVVPGTTKLPPSLAKRPATTWTLTHAGRTGANAWWDAILNPRISRVVFYFQMNKITTDASDPYIQKLNALSDYNYFGLVIIGDKMHVEYMYSDFAYNRGNKLFEGIIKDDNNSSEPFIKSFSDNVAQFTFNEWHWANAGGNDSNDPNNRVTVLKKAATTIEGVVHGPNPAIGIGAPFQSKSIDSNIDTMIIPGSTLKFARNVNTISKADKSELVPYMGYLGAWEVMTDDYLSAGLGNDVTQDSSITNAEANTDNSCGCGVVSGADIMNILKRAFCAVICWTFNVGKGLQQNATCLFNTALGTIKRGVVTNAKTYRDISCPATTN